MKNFTLILFFLSCWSVKSQLPENLKYDKLTYSYDSATVLIQKGKLTSVYNLRSNQMEIGPTKNLLLNFHPSNSYAEILPKSQQLCIHVLSDSGHTQVFSSTDTCYIGFPSPKESSGYIDFNGIAVDQETNETGNPENIRLDWARYEIIKCPNGLYILNGYSSDEFYFNSSNDELLNIYPVNSSGVYSTIEKKWIIDPLYKSCQLMNGYFFCLRADQIITHYADADIADEYSIAYSYDLYQLIGTTANELVGNATQLENDLLSKILGVEQLTQFDDSQVYATEKNGKQGLVHFQMMDPENPKEAGFFYAELIPPIADFVNYSFFYDKVSAMYSDSIKPLVIYDYTIDFYSEDRPNLAWRASDESEVGMHVLTYERQQVIFDGRHQYYEGGRLKYPDTADDSTFEVATLTADRDFSQESHFGLELEESGRLVVNNWCAPYHQPEEMPLMSIQYPGEDSIIFNPTDGSTYLVYAAAEPGFLKSGIYDPVSGSWITDPAHRVINPNEYYYFLQTTNEEPQSDCIFIIVDSTGTEVASGINFQEIVSNLGLLKYAASYPADSMFIAPAGFRQHTKIDITYPGYYVAIGQKLGLYQPGPELQNLWPNNVHDFVHYHPDLKFMYYLEGDSLYLQTECDTVSVSRSGKIIFTREDYVSEYDPQPYYFLLTIEKNDTTFYNSGWKPGSNSYTTSSIEVKNNRIIVNDHTSSAIVSCLECLDESNEFYNEESDFESENSAVWGQNKNGWRQISPNYATIEPVSNGWYIASTGSYFHGFDVYDRVEGTATDIPSRYFLLDSNLNPIQYLDYFDFPDIQDLGFGLKIKLDSGHYFFMTYDGIAVTDATWDHFEKENGKLKAILNTVYQVDENGELILDEFGNPIDVVSRTVKYFRLP